MFYSGGIVLPQADPAKRALQYPTLVLHVVSEQELSTDAMRNACRRTAAGAIVFGVAAIHLLRVGANLRGLPYQLYYSYASDILLPLAMYFLLCLSEPNLPFVRDWRVKAALVFAAASIAEVLQGLGVPMLGSTFDPADFLMYGAGVFIAVLLDKLALPLLCRDKPSVRGTS